MFGLLGFGLKFYLDFELFCLSFGFDLGRYLGFGLLCLLFGLGLNFVLFEMRRAVCLALFVGLKSL